MTRKLPVPSLTRTRQFVRESLKLGFMQAESSTREYWCPLDMQERRREHDQTISHRISLAYWVAQPPTREQIVRRFHEHFTDECSRTEGER